jgi:hypothetical protein
MKLKTMAEERLRWRAESLDQHEIILLDDIDTLLSMLEWQPIATAPKDGKPFLGIRAGRNPEIWYWDEQKYNKRPKPYFASVGHAGSYTDRENQPTHWMPLPTLGVTS